jgi:hypothetical protein
MRFQCSVSLPSRGAFHRSLAVLCAIGRHRYLALEGGPPRFPRATSCPVVLAHPSPRGAGFRLRGSHPLWRAVPGPSSSPAPLRWARGSGPQTGRTTPAPQRLPASCTARVWAAPRSLATTRGILSFPRGTEMFQFPHLPPPRLCVQRGVTGHDPRRVAPFGHRRRIACLRPTVAFRSLPRPSSARVAEASTAYRFLLERDASRPRPCPAAAREPPLATARHH